MLKYSIFKIKYSIDFKPRNLFLRIILSITFSFDYFFIFAYIITNIFDNHNFNEINDINFLIINLGKIMIDHLLFIPFVYYIIYIIYTYLIILLFTF